MLWNCPCIGLNEVGLLLTLRCLDESGLRERDSHIFGLAAIDCVCWHRVPEQLALGATTSLAPNTVIALLACCVKGNHDFVANVELLHRVTFLDNFAHELMPADKVGRLHGCQVPRSSFRMGVKDRLTHLR
jgi:hypothetical protein